MNLLSIAQVNYDLVYPNATAETSVKVEHMIEDAKMRYAWELFRTSKEEKRADGWWEIPSVLWREADIEVVDNKADISSLHIFRSFEGDTWLGMIGGEGCGCSYTRQSVNISQMLCEEDYWGNSKPYYVVGKTIRFPGGAHKDTLPIVYASDGTDLNDEIDIDEGIGALVSEYLYKKYSGKFAEDRTADSNTNRP